MDNIQKVVLFNEMAGNECTARSIGDGLPDLYMSLIKEEHLGDGELAPSYAANDLRGVLDGAADLIVVAAGLIHVLGFDVNEVLGIVCDSNLSKFDKSLEDAVTSVASYENDSRYTEVHYLEVNGMYVIRGKKVGEEEKGWKILKSHKYVEADFAEVLKNQKF